MLYLDRAMPSAAAVPSLLILLLGVSFSWATAAGAAAESLDASSMAALQLDSEGVVATFLLQQGHKTKDDLTKRSLQHTISQTQLKPENSDATARREVPKGLQFFGIIIFVLVVVSVVAAVVFLWKYL
eukprot:TRINITY_DN41774_c0_g1_i1.p1 TRINITY_DN41774_c0_g1~~TRINITY_DN41774_c0_g1_i1.p1  ORF type:complete len:128 (+),score=17.18 TRINITY_DN41774_c0_g1_i1:95-478(+)